MPENEAARRRSSCRWFVGGACRQRKIQDYCSGAPSGVGGDCTDPATCHRWEQAHTDRSVRCGQCRYIFHTGALSVCTRRPLGGGPPAAVREVGASPDIQQQAYEVVIPRYPACTEFVPGRGKG
jgi:hypothetical protein